MPESTSILDHLLAREVVMCVGPGGVGKTTTSAALALVAARRGKRVVVVTIDPSRRLAQALGLSADAKTRHTHPAQVWQAEGGGRLDALLLDAKDVFDAIVLDCASSPEAAQALLRNHLYVTASERLAGALEYAAMARLQMLHASRQYDLVVLDTPPTTNAQDFLDAPRRIRELLENPAVRLIVGSSKTTGRLIDFGAQLGGQMLLRVLSTMGGGQFMQDLSGFLREFSGVIRAFHERGGKFEELLRSPKSATLLTTAAADFSIREGMEFYRQLANDGFRMAGVVLNRADPLLPPATDELRRWVQTHASTDTDPAALVSLYEEGVVAGERARAAMVELSTTLRCPVGIVPRRVPPPEGLEELAAVGEALFGDPSAWV